MKEQIDEIVDKIVLGALSQTEATEELLNLFSVSGSLPVACTMEDDKGELGWTRLSAEYAGEVITTLTKKVRAFEEFIDSFNENYR